MKNATIRDNYPYYPPAGLGSTVPDPPVFDVSGGESTPTKLFPFRKTHAMSVGGRSLRRNYPALKEGRVYGVAIEAGPGVESCLRGAPTDEPKVLLEAKENIYASNRLEPLGRGMVRGHVFPAKVNDPNFMFGSRTVPTNTTTKHTLQNGEFLAESAETHALYKASHRDVYPGEQKNRAYNWPFDIATHVFAKPNRGEIESVDLCLKMNTPDHLIPLSSTVVPKSQSDFKALTKDILGVSATNKLNAACEEYMRSKIIPKPSDVAETLKPGPLSDDGFDPSLGRATRPGFRNFAKPADQDRTFGLKTAELNRRNIFGAKSDPSKPTGFKESVIVPVGVCEEMPELENLQRSKEEVKTLLRKAGVEYCSAKFEAVWLRAIELEIRRPEEELIKETVCMRSVMQALRELHYL